MKKILAVIVAVFLGAYAIFRFFDQQEYVDIPNGEESQVDPCFLILVFRYIVYAIPVAIMFYLNGLIVRFTIKCKDLEEGGKMA